MSACSGGVGKGGGEAGEGGTVVGWIGGLGRFAEVLMVSEAGATKVARACLLGRKGMRRRVE